MKRILLYGGAFNPPHLGHERLLKAAIETIKPNMTFVIPSEVSPHKDNAHVSFFDRAHMARTFLSCGNHVKISGMEYTGSKRKSYTIHTVKRLRAKYKNAQFFLLIGSDMLMTFSEWRHYRRLCAMVTLVAASRLDNGNTQQLNAAKCAIERMGGSVVLLEYKALEMSSTQIRQRIQEGEDISAFVSAFVADYINKRKLYL